jgi:hypothetical protein
MLKAWQAFVFTHTRLLGKLQHTTQQTKLANAKIWQATKTQHTQSFWETYKACHAQNLASFLFCTQTHNKQSLATYNLQNLANTKHNTTLKTWQPIHNTQTHTNTQHTKLLATHTQATSLAMPLCLSLYANKTCKTKFATLLSFVHGKFCVCCSVVV